MFVEIGLGFNAERRMGDVDVVSEGVRRDVEAAIPGAKVTVVATAWWPEPAKVATS